MPYLYRVMNEGPKTVQAWGYIKGTEITTLPTTPNKPPWPSGSFCAALIGNDTLLPKDIKLALTRFRPPPATGTPYLYRFDLSNNYEKLGELPDHCFVGTTGNNAGSVEVIVTAQVPVSEVEVLIGGNWKQVTKVE